MSLAETISTGQIYFFAGKTLFAFVVASANLEVFQVAAADFRKATRLGHISGAKRWADLHKEFRKTLLQLGPATRDLKLVKEAAAVFETSIKHGNTEQKIHVFCMIGMHLPCSMTELQNMSNSKNASGERVRAKNHMLYNGKTKLVTK